MGFKFNPFTGNFDVDNDAVGAVTSVSNSDGSLIISPTVGAAIASLNTAHTNTFTARQIISQTNGMLPTFEVSNAVTSGASSSVTGQDYSLVQNSPVDADYASLYGIIFTLINNHDCNGALSFGIPEIIGQRLDITDAADMSGSFGGGWVDVKGIEVSVSKPGTTTGLQANTQVKGIDIVAGCSQSYNNAGGTFIKDVRGLNIYAATSGAVTAGTLTANTYGAYFYVTGTTGGTSTAYGIYIDTVSGADTNYAIYSNTTALSKLLGDLEVPDEAYGSGWNGSLEVPTKNAVYDKIETLVNLPYTEKTANYTITTSDYTINCTSGTFAVTLPTAVGITGRVFVIKNSGSGTITLNTTSSQTIDGNASGALTALPKESYRVQSTGANWIII